LLIGSLGAAAKASCEFEKFYRGNVVLSLFGLVAEIFFGFVMLAFFAARFVGEMPFDESSAMARYQWRRSSPSGLPSFSQI
jgi:hypothetical protein